MSDAPLLFAAGVERECDATVVVEASRDVRLRRVIEKRGWDEVELGRRERVQMPLEEKRARCDHVVVNEGDDAALVEAVERVFGVVRGS